MHRLEASHSLAHPSLPILQDTSVVHCCIPPTILHRHNSKESTVHLCHTRTLSDNPIRLTRPA
jgi:hypothetical protein